jgi:large subunit ribosomal protein L13
VLDAKGCKVGHLAGQIARILIGKHKPIYNPTVDSGDYVVVKNVEKIIFTGDKWKQKLYRWHTRYPGGLKEVKAQDMLVKHPDLILRKAVSGMLPKNRLRRVRLRKLRLYVGPHHPHEAQVSAGYHYKVEHIEKLRPDELSAEQVKEMAKDPEAYLAKVGGEILSLDPEPDGITFTVERVRGTEQKRTFKSTRARRLRRIERLQKLVTEIQGKAASEKAKRESLS